MSKKINISDSSECFSEEILLKYVNDELSPEENATIESHILDCEMCSDVVDGLLLMESTDDYLAAKELINKDIDSIINATPNKKGSLFTLIRSVAAVAVLVILSGSYFLINYLVKDKNIQDVNKTIGLSDKENAANTNQENQIAELTNAEKADTQLEQKKILEDKLIPAFEAPIIADVSINEDYWEKSLDDSELGKIEMETDKESDDAREIVENIVGEESLEFFKGISGENEVSTGSGAVVNTTTQTASKSSAGGFFDDLLPISKNEGNNKRDNKDAQNAPGNPERSENEKTGNELVSESHTIVEASTIVADMIILDDSDLATDEEEVEPISFSMVETKPMFPEGETALIKYISENIVYPEISKTNGISGKVYIQFTIDKEGYVKNVLIVKGVDPYLDAEALRVIKSLPRWTPGKQRGNPVDVTFVMPVSFSLF